MDRFLKKSHVKRLKKIKKKFPAILNASYFFYFRYKIFYMGNIRIEGGNTPTHPPIPCELKSRPRLFIL
jgi:hypothetical protein